MSDKGRLAIGGPVEWVLLGACSWTWNSLECKGKDTKNLAKLKTINLVARQRVPQSGILACQEKSSGELKESCHLKHFFALIFEVSAASNSSTAVRMEYHKLPINY
jgi:hypothetical protein